jgi:hypothetical protein
MGETRMKNPSDHASQDAQQRSPEPLPVRPELLEEPLPRPIPQISGEPATMQPATPEAGVLSGQVDANATFAQEVHEYIRDYIALADQKATFFFTGATALVAFLYSKGITGNWSHLVRSWRLLDFVAFLAVTLLAVAALLSILVVIPRTPGSCKGYIFWEAIAQYESGSAYADRVAQLSPASLLRVKAEHCYDLARVCRMKYRWLRLALRVGAGGLAATLVYFFLARVGH